MNPALVGWCDECEAYVEPYDKGQACDADHSERPDGTFRVPGFTKTLRKRRMYICRLCPDAYGYFDRSEYMDHMREGHLVWGGEEALLYPSLTLTDSKGEAP